MDMVRSILKRFRPEEKPAVVGLMLAAATPFVVLTEQWVRFAV